MSVTWRRASGFYRDGIGLDVLMDHVFEGDWPTLFDAPSSTLRSVFLGDPAHADAGVVELVTFDPPGPDGGSVDSQSDAGGLDGGSRGGLPSRTLGRDRVLLVVVLRRRRRGPRPARRDSGSARGAGSSSPGRPGRCPWRVCMTPTGSASSSSASPPGSSTVLRSETRILTTHAGSLPRPRSLAELHGKRSRGEEVDSRELEREVVRRHRRGRSPRRSRPGSTSATTGSRPARAS